MTIVVTGAGSGGHITPILAVAQELKKLDPTIKIVYIGQKGDKLTDVASQSELISKSYTIPAGKFRRYNRSFVASLLDIPTLLKNIRDIFRVISGVIQAYFLLGRLKPSIIFVKGGYIGVPVGLAAAARSIPYITHDSDSIPGLANRIISRWALLHAVALPPENYSYPKDKTVMVGVPLRQEFRYVTRAEKDRLKQEIGVPTDKKLVVLSGGGLGAKSINIAATEAIPKLLNQNKDVVVIHIVGRTNDDLTQRLYDKKLSDDVKDRLILKTFITDLYKYNGAADLAVTRAGATSLAELAVQGVPTLVIPNPYLVAGHQLKNAEVLEKAGAIKVLREDEMIKDPNRLYESISFLLFNDDVTDKLGTNFRKFAQDDAAKHLAELLINNAR